MTFYRSLCSAAAFASVVERLKQGATFTKTAPPVQAPPTAYFAPLPPAGMNLPELSDDEIFSFLEHARSLKAAAAARDPARGASFAETASKTATSAGTGSKAETQAQNGGGGAPPIAPWMYLNPLDPPAWLRFNLSSLSGMPVTRPPPVPRMMPPPPPVMFPEFSYTRPAQGPYAPPRTAVPAYSMSMPPAVPAAQWIPLSAYIQPPRDVPTPDVVAMAEDAAKNGIN